MSTSDKKPLPPTPPVQREVFWIGNTKKAVGKFPEEVREDMFAAIDLVTRGGTPSDAKPWTGDGSGVWELVEAHEGNAYRGVYVVGLTKGVYVVHAFQKKSPDGGKKVDRRDKEAVAKGVKAARDHDKIREKKEL